MLTYGMDPEKKYYSTSEVAALLGVSRVAVFKQIKAGKIRAEKIGRNYIILREDLPSILRPELAETEKTSIDQAVKKAVQEYEVTLKKLGRE